MTKLEIAKTIRGANYDCQAYLIQCGDCPFTDFCSGAVAELSRSGTALSREAFISQVNMYIRNNNETEKS